MIFTEHCRKTEISDIIPFSKTINGVHLAELEAHGLTAEEGVRYSHAMSNKCYSMIERETGEVSGMFGLCSTHQQGVGHIWALTNDNIFKHKLRLHKSSMDFINEAHNDYDILTNVIWVGNTTHLKWLQVLGFVVINEITINNNNFYEFVRIK